MTAGNKEAQAVASMRFLIGSLVVLFQNAGLRELDAEKSSFYPTAKGCLSFVPAPLAKA